MCFDANVITEPGQRYTFEVINTGGSFAVEGSQAPGLYPDGILYAFGIPREDCEANLRGAQAEGGNFGVIV